MSRLRGTSRSHSSVSSLSSHSDPPLTPPSTQPHHFRQLTLVPQMKSVKSRSPRDTSKLTLTRASSLAAAHDNDAGSTTSSSQQSRKQKTLDSFLVPKTQPVTAEQRRQQRRERKERKERTAATTSSPRHRIAAVTVDGEEDEDAEDARQQRMRREAEMRERQRALKEERIDSDDEEDIPLFRIALPTLPSSLPAAPSTPSSSSQSQSSLPSSLSSSVSSAIPSSASPCRRLKDEEDDEWDDAIPSFVLQPQQNHLAHPLPPPQLRALPTPYQPPPPPPPAAAPVTAVNPFAQSASLSGPKGSMKAEWDDAPRVRLPLSQMLQSLSEAKSTASAAQRPSTAAARVKQERTSPSPAEKENISPLITPAANATPAKSTNAQRSSPSFPSSPPPLEPATQQEPITLQRNSSAASDHSVDSISSVEEEAAVIRPHRVKRERVRAPVDDIEDECELLPHTRETGAISRGALFPSRLHSSTSALPMASAGPTAPSFFAPAPSARSLLQPQPMHPSSDISPLLASPPPSAFFPHCASPPLPASHHPQYAGLVESWPLAFPQAEDGEESKQPAGLAGGVYSFRGISELQGQASVNYGQIFQPKEKRKRRTSEQKDEHGESKGKKKKKAKSKRRKTEGEADDEREDEKEAEERKEGGRDKKKKSGQKKRSGRWCTVNGVRTYIVGGKRLTGSVAYMAYKQESGGSSSSKKERSRSKKKKTVKGTKRKSSGKKGKSKKEARKQRPDGDDSGEEEWQPADGGEGSGGGEGGSGDESAGSLADFIVGDDFIESASSEGD